MTKMSKPEFLQYYLNKYRLEKIKGLLSRVTDPGGVGPDPTLEETPDPTFMTNPDPT